MKVYLCKDVAKVGAAGEILKVSDGFAKNFLIPNNLAVVITPDNERFYQSKIKVIEHRKEVIETATSLLAERIKSIELTVKCKMHDNGQLYGSIPPNKIVDLLAEKGISISKNQVLFDKTVKKKGKHEVIIKLSSRLQPTLILNVIPE